MPGALIDLKGLTEPAKVLIERISDAVGGLARPWQIERIARAEGRAEVIKAEAQIAVTEVERRAIRRLVAEEGKKQENIESIAGQAAEKVREDARPGDIEADWLTSFFERCRNISDDQMQSIWASLLADEANSPGRYQRKTIDLLATLGRVDANLFAQLKPFTLHVANRVLPVIYDHNDKLLESHGLDFEKLTHLQELGLINFNVTSNYQLTINADRLPLSYGPSVVWLHLKPDRKLDFGRVLFTKAGTELIGLCAEARDAAILESWKDRWRSLTLLEEEQVATSS
jgi:hypothetical protein